MNNVVNCKHCLSGILLKTLNERTFIYLKNRTDSLQEFRTWLKRWVLYLKRRTMHPKPRLPHGLKCNHYTPNQHQQHKWAALVWRGWLTSSLIIGQMPIPTLQEWDSEPIIEASRCAHSRKWHQEYMSFCWACQRKSALHQIKCKHQLKSRVVETVQSEIWSELPNNPSRKVNFYLAACI